MFTQLNLEEYVVHKAVCSLHSALNKIQIIDTEKLYDSRQMHINLVIEWFILLRQCSNPYSVKYGIWLMHRLPPLLMLLCLPWQISPEGLGMMYLLDVKCIILVTMINKINQLINRWSSYSWVCPMPNYYLMQCKHIVNMTNLDRTLIFTNHCGKWFGKCSLLAISKTHITKRCLAKFMSIHHAHDIILPWVQAISVSTYSICQCRSVIFAGFLCERIPA